MQNRRSGGSRAELLWGRDAEDCHTMHARSLSFELSQLGQGRSSGSVSVQRHHPAETVRCEALTPMLWMGSVRR